MDGTMDVTTFLSSCKESGNQAYANFKEVLAHLQDEETRAEARRFLTALEEKTSHGTPEEIMSTYHFRIHKLVLSDLHDPALDLTIASSINNGQEGPQQQQQQTLTLLEMSSIFLPEAWSFTFYEGLTRHPDAGFAGRDVTELGCGNGWISIALAQRWLPRKVYGLDINPRAVKVACINLYLNGLSPEGEAVVDHEGLTLLDRVEFYESDLLGYIKDKGILLDRIVGCIPQVLTPDPKAALRIVSETMSEEFLHSLSNYCSLQGYVEDQFGLGLIARAVEESIAVLKPTGALIMNMGGRPGLAVSERLFRRRGFVINKLWSTRVCQAADTDITALVEIERDSRHRFEFYMGAVSASAEVVSARTAYAYAKAGGEIWHGLTVFECRLRQPTYVKEIFHFLSQKGYEETRSALDLAFTSDAVADEKVPFLAYLARSLHSGNMRSANGPSAGNLQFRAQVASFLRLYFRAPVSLQNVVTLPTRSVAIETILRLYSPALALVETSLCRSLPRAWISAVPPVSTDGTQQLRQAKSHPAVLEAPRRSDLLLKLIQALSPQLVIASLADYEMRSTTSVQLLLEAAARCGARIFFDISDYLELSSSPATNGVLQLLAEQALPPHAGIICGLVKNQVYSDLEVAFVLSESSVFTRGLACACEVTYHRVPELNQLYYGCLLHELLAFQIRERHQLEPRPLVPDPPSSPFIPIQPAAELAFAHPSIQSGIVSEKASASIAAAAAARAAAAAAYQTGGIPSLTESEEARQKQPATMPHSVPPYATSPPEPKPKAVTPARAALVGRDAPVLRMDVGSSALPTIPLVQRFVFEAFARQNLSEAETDPRPEILQILHSDFNIPSEGTTVVTGNGSRVVFARLMAACAASRGTAVVPSGSYGGFVATAKFFGVTVAVVPPTYGPEGGFKLDEKTLDSFLSTISRPWLILSAPVVNPTGALYSPSEIAALLSVCQRRGAKVILDACFSDLQFDGSNSSSPENQINLEPYLGKGSTDAAGKTGEAVDKPSLGDETAALAEASGEPASPPSSYALALLGQLSPQLSAVGIPFAYVAVWDSFFKEALWNTPQPHITLRYAIKRMLSSEAFATLAVGLKQQRLQLSDAARKLCEALSECGWVPVRPKGGFFLVARPTAFEGMSFTYERPACLSETIPSPPSSSTSSSSSSSLHNKARDTVSMDGNFVTVKLDSVNIADALFATTGLLINNSQWTSLPGYCRFVVLQDEKKLSDAVAQLKKFCRLVKGQ